MATPVPIFARGLAPSARAVADTGEPDAPAPPTDGGDGGGGRGPWVTVATFWASAPAHMARLRLEADDIPAVLLDEHVTSFCYAYAFGGIKLQVPADRLADARRALEVGAPPDDDGTAGDSPEVDPAALDALVAAHGQADDDLDGPDSDDDPDDDDSDCRACGGTGEAAGAGYDRLLFAAVLLLPLLTLGRWGVPAYLAAVLLAFAAVRRGVGRCRTCGRTAPEP